MSGMRHFCFAALFSDPMAVLSSVHQSLELVKSLKDAIFLGQKSVFFNIYKAMFAFQPAISVILCPLSILVKIFYGKSFFFFFSD